MRRARRRLSSEARLFNPGLIVVLAPNPRGLRHYVDPDSTYSRTLCGLNPELWMIDLAGGPAGCERCLKGAGVHRARARARLERMQAAP